jgi:integrase
MSKTRLTPERIRAFATSKPQDFLWDAATPGLGVRATASGAKSFIWQGRLHGKSVRRTVGDARAWTLDQARAEARRLQMLLDQGIDPREEKAKRQAEAIAKREEARRKAVTVGEAWQAYIAARKHKWSARHLAAHEQVANAGGVKRKRGGGVTECGPLAALMPERLAALTPERIAAWLKAEAAKRPTYAALTFRLLRAFLRWASEQSDYRGLVQASATTARAVRDHVPRVKAKGDCLQREQLAPWFAAVRAIGNPVISAYLQALLLTGARREELAGLKWADVDFQWKSLIIRDKVDGERIIPLTPYVAHLLATLPRRNEWVFSSPAAASGRLQEPRIAHDRALKAAGLPHITLHALRRSFATLSEWVECPVGVVAQLMGHKPSAIAEKHYRRCPLDLLRMWHTKIEAWILEQAGIQQPGEDARPLRIVSLQ